MQVIRDERDFRNRLNAEQNARKDYDGVSPKLGVIFRPSEAQQLFANISRSFEPPTFFELNQTNQPTNPGFVPLKAQKAWTAEVGSRGALGAHAYEVSVYRAAVDDQLLGFSVDPAAGVSPPPSTPRPPRCRASKRGSPAPCGRIHRATRLRIRSPGRSTTSGSTTTGSMATTAWPACRSIC